jgi:hypothetical protein
MFQVRDMRIREVYRLRDRPEDPITVPEEVASNGVPWEGVTELLGRPLSRLGKAVTLKCRMHRRSLARTRETYKIWNRMGTVKKSTETKLLTWLLRQVRQVCEGGFRRRTRYVLTLVSPMLMPSFRSSP